MIAGETPLAVQLWTKDAKDHHLHGVSNLSIALEMWVWKRKVLMHYIRILTHDSPVRSEIFH